jgi:uncharacterized protein (TIGR02453 family)
VDLPRLHRFLAGLAAHNRKAWFEAQREEYQGLKDDFTAWVGELVAGIAEWDDTVRWVDPTAAIFRLHRDVRFSPDKTPYKTHFSAFISDGGRRGGLPGYYLQLDQAGTLLAAGGVYLPPREPLNRIRDYIAAHPERLRRVLRDPALRDTFGGISGERLLRPPAGFAPTTPLIEQIKLKSFILRRERPLGEEDETAWLLETFRAMAPFQRWLRKALAG